LDFDLTVDDVVIPDVCPLLGIKLQWRGRNDGKTHADSPSLDRKDSTKGYTKDNVWVISHRANTIKNSASPEEFERIFTAWRQNLLERTISATL
jgi:hypothetical protein